MNNNHTMNSVLISGLVCLSTAAVAQKKADKTPNILLIVADDLNCSTTPMFGCKVPDLMPNIENLSKEGMLFKRAHIVSGASQVSRGGIMTGLYPHNSGIDGFYHTDKDIPTFQETLQANNYRIGIAAKVSHSTPKATIEWDYTVDGQDIHQGRDPQVYYDSMTKFISDCKKEGKPFFFMANSIDPHRPFAGSLQEKQKMGTKRSYPDPERFYKPEEIEVPRFVPDLPEVRVEVAQYFSSVKRLDQTVGMVLKALKDTGMEDNTIVIFLSDNGMSLPFAKTCSYLHSTHTPLIVKYPGVTKPGSIDDTHFVNGIDFMPTILEAASIPVPDGLDGKSYLPLLGGKKQSNRDYIFTEFTENSGRTREPMRAVQNERYGYIYNVWSNGSYEFKSETTAGLTFTAMQNAATNDPAIKERVDMFVHRQPEEFYDYEKDPDALHNLINDPAYSKQIGKYRAMMEKHLEQTNDPVLQPFRNRNNAEFVNQYMQNQLAIVKKRMQEDASYKNRKESNVKYKKQK